MMHEIRCSLGNIFAVLPDHHKVTYQQNNKLLMKDSYSSSRYPPYRRTRALAFSSPAKPALMSCKHLFLRSQLIWRCQHYHQKIQLIMNNCRQITMLAEDAQSVSSCLLVEGSHFLSYSRQDLAYKFYQGYQERSLQFMFACSCSQLWQQNSSTLFLQQHSIYSSSFLLQLKPCSIQLLIQFRARFRNRIYYLFISWMGWPSQLKDQINLCIFFPRVQLLPMSILDIMQQEMASKEQKSFLSQESNSGISFEGCPLLQERLFRILDSDILEAMLLTSLAISQDFLSLYEKLLLHFRGFMETDLTLLNS